MINQQIGPREDYANLQITIAQSQAGGQTFPVIFEVLRWRYFDPVMLQINPAELLPLAADPGGYGQMLGKMVFGKDGVGDYYAETIAAVQARGDGLRVRLVVEPKELQEILWERIYHPVAGEWRPLGSTAVTPFSRFIRPQQWDRPMPVTKRPLRMLVVIASPSNLESDFGLSQVDTVERQSLYQLFDQIPDLSVMYLESGTSTPPTLNAIRKALADGYHMVHFLCHGARTPAGVGLFLENENGMVDPVAQDRLVEMFKVLQSPPIFVFLAACESAKHDRHDAMLPLGPALVEDGGIQAAIAMTGKVGLKIAQVFTGQFYARLFKHGLVDLAMNEARALIQDDWDWGVPVLFSRLGDNQLIDFPIGSIYENYLVHSGSAFTTVDEALAAARLEDHGQKLVMDLQALVDELRKSHGVLVDVATRFRRTGRDPQDFAEKFEDFYYAFKDYYDGQTWVNENTSCGEIGELRAKILPKLSPILHPVQFEQLKQELDLLSNADSDLVRYFRDYLDIMNGVMDEIWSAVAANDVETALQLKRDFEAQISPSFQRSKAMFERMSNGIQGVRRA